MPIGPKPPRLSSTPPSPFVHLSGYNSEFVAGSARAAAVARSFSDAPSIWSSLGKLRRRDRILIYNRPRLADGQTAPVLRRLDVERHPQAVVPEDLQKVAPTAHRKTKRSPACRVPGLRASLALQGASVFMPRRMSVRRASHTRIIATDRDHLAAGATRTRESAEASTRRHPPSTRVATVTARHRARQGRSAETAPGNRAIRDHGHWNQSAAAHRP